MMKLLPRYCLQHPGRERNTVTLTLMNRVLDDDILDGPTAIDNAEGTFELTGWDAGSPS